MELICKRCGKEWDYKGKKQDNPGYAIYTSCPQCRTLVKIIHPPNEKPSKVEVELEFRDMEHFNENKEQIVNSFNDRFSELGIDIKGITFK